MPPPLHVSQQQRTHFGPAKARSGLATPTLNRSRAPGRPIENFDQTQIPPMRLAFILLAGGLLSACTAGNAPSVRANPGTAGTEGKPTTTVTSTPSAVGTVPRPVASISLGAPRLEVAPPGSSISGYKTVVFPVRAKNISRKPVWVYGIGPDWPIHTLFIRQADGFPWTDETLAMCALGAGFHELAPGTSTTFTVFVSAEEVGHQIRIELPVYVSPDPQTEPLCVSSPPTPIRFP